MVHTAVEAMDLSILLSRYPGGGRPPYHPKMMLKILLYAYAKGIYSSRKIEEQLHENIHFMWLSDENTRLSYDQSFSIGAHERRDL